MRYIEPKDAEDAATLSLTEPAILVQRTTAPEQRRRLICVALTEKDDAWVDVVDDLHWLDDGRKFTWISERDGWRHLYVASRDGAKVRLVTPGPFDLHNPGSAFGAPLVVGVDSAAGWIYYTASPDNASGIAAMRRRGSHSRPPVDAAEHAGVPTR